MRAGSLQKLIKKQRGRPRRMKKMSSYERWPNRMKKEKITSINFLKGPITIKKILRIRRMRTYQLKSLKNTVINNCKRN